MGQPDSPSPEQDAELTVPERYTIRINRLSFLAIAIFGFCVMVAVWQYPLVFVALEAIVVAILIWTIRNQTTLTPQDLTLRTTFSRRTIAWSDLKGIRVPKRRWIRAVLLNGEEVTLPAVSYDRLPELIVASHGHIPDPWDYEPKSAG